MSSSRVKKGEWDVLSLESGCTFRSTLIGFADEMGEFVSVAFVGWFGGCGEYAG